MYSILFVCHGNICRSPMAEFIFSDMLRHSPLNGRVFVSSAATSAEEIVNGIGKPMYPPAIQELRSHGIPCPGHFSVQVRKEDYDRYDLILCMDLANMRNIMRIFGTDPKCKVKRLLDLVTPGCDVSDPWYTRRFDIAYEDIRLGCAALLDILQKELR